MNMFCKKKTSCAPVIFKTMGWILAAVGAATLTTWALAKCGCLGHRAKCLAKKCETAIGDAMHPTDSTDACPLDPEDYHLPTCNAPRA